MLHFFVGYGITYYRETSLNLVERDRALSSWAVVGALALVMTASYGAQFSFGIFLKPMVEEFGWTRAMASGAISMVAGVAGVAGIVMGRLTDKYGARLIIASGALLGGLGFLLMSQVNSLWQLYLYFGATVGICIGSCWTPINATVSKLFVEKRVLALGITTSGITLGRMLVPPLAAYVVTFYDWRRASMMLSIIVWMAAIPAIMLLRRRSSQGLAGKQHVRSADAATEGEIGKSAQPRQWSVTEAARTVPFWMLAATGYIVATGFFFVAVHMVAYATDMGMTATAGALVLTVMGGVAVLGRVIVAPISIRIGSRITMVLFLFLQALALLLLTQATSPWMLFALGSLFGLGFGVHGTVRLSVMSEFFGVRSIGTIMGMIGIAWACGGITGPFLAGYVFDVTHSYHLAFLGGGLLMLVGMVAASFLKPPGRTT